MNVQERQALVRDFMRKIGEPASDTPELPDERRAALRVALIMEEVLELASALGVDVEANRASVMTRPSGRQVNLVEVVDALRDIEYHIHGIELALGVHEATDETFLEVHRSNMDKEPLGEGECRKVTKPTGWKPPDIAGVLKKKYPRKALLFRK